MDLDSLPIEPITQSQLAVWLIAAFVVVVMVDAVMRVLDRFKDKPPLHEVYATRQEHDNLARAVVDLSEKCDRRFAAASERGSESREKMYESIRALERAGSAQTETNRAHSLHLSSLDAKLDKILDRLPPKS